MEKRPGMDPPASEQDTGARSTADRVLDTIAVTLELDRAQLGLDSRIEQDLDADSLDVLSLVMALEDEFGAQLDRDQAGRFTTIGDIVAYIESRGP